MTENTSSPDKSSIHGTKKSSSPKERVFQYDDCKYIDCGQLWALQISQAILMQGVKELNFCKKVGRPSVFSNTCFAVTFLFRNATGTRYRQLQGSCRDDCQNGKRIHILDVPEEDDVGLTVLLHEKGRRQHGCRMCSQRAAPGLR